MTGDPDAVECLVCGLTVPWDRTAAYPTPHGSVTVCRSCFRVLGGTTGPTGGT